MTPAPIAGNSYTAPYVQGTYVAVEHMPGGGGIVQYSDRAYLPEEVQLRRKLANPVTRRTGQLIDAGLTPYTARDRAAMNTLVAERLRRGLIDSKGLPLSYKDRSEVIGTVTEQLIEEASRLVGRPVSYLELREIVAQSVDRRLTSGGAAGKRLMNESMFGRLGRQGRRFFRMGAIRRDTATLRGTRRTSERGWQRLERKARWSNERDAELALLSTTFPEARIIVTVKNESKWLANGIIISCSTVGPTLPRTLEKGRTFRYPFDVEYNKRYVVSCSSTTHKVEPDEQEVDTRRKKGSGKEFPITFVLKEKEDIEKKIGAPVKKAKLGVRKDRQAYYQAVLYPLLLLMVGVIVSAILGSAFFVFAFLSFAVSKGVPSPEVGRDIVAKLEDVKKRYQALIERAERSREPREIIDRLYKRMESEIKVEAIVGKFEWKKIVTTSHYGRGFVKEFFKGLGFLFLALAFILSPIPLAPVIGIIIGFFGYFSLGGSDYHVDHEKEGH